LWAKLCFDFVAIVFQWQAASDEDWALALAREAVIRPLTDQPEVTEELVVTASTELGISRSLVYRLVAKFRTAAAGFANRSGVLIVALFTYNHPRAPTKCDALTLGDNDHHGELMTAAEPSRWSNLVVSDRDALHF